jgi:preprotein translocase subunit SecA
MGFFDTLFGGDSITKKLEPTVAKINALESAYSSISLDDLKAKTAELKDRLAKGENLEDMVPEAFALVREASKRTLGQRHFDVQLMGGLVLHNGGISEMKTGEGKTLVATLPVYTNALLGKGVHVVTVNDYLSKRDAAWMGQIYNALGLSVGIIIHDESFLYDPSHTDAREDKTRDELGSFKVVTEFLRPCTRQEAYNADITYGTNNEFGFDFLRDQIEYDKRNLRQRPHHFAIVDEVDSILIDEARTPLIISSPTTEAEDFYKRFASIAKQLVKDVDYTVDEKFHSIALNDAGINHAEKLLGVDNIYTDKGIKYVHHLETAVKAQALYDRDKAYVVKDGEVVIVDEFTGRMQPGRRWSEGLHQAIEAKENVPIQKESRTFASITFQNYFRLYKKLSGMTGTAKTSAEEFFKVYGLHVEEIPTNKKVQRIDKNDLIFRTEAGKFKAVAREVKERFKTGEPVLIGTVSIEKNELLSAYLKAEGVPHEVLNAKNHTREGEIVAQAGKKGAVTIATNMAGRGVDVKLGGNPGSPDMYEQIKSIGGLFVLGTERHDARRIDNQLRGRSGRQGDPGETQFFVSLEDDLMRVFGGEKMKNMMMKLGIPEDQPIENRLITRSIEQAQEKIEGFNFDARKHVLDFDDVLNYQRKIFYGRRYSILTGDSTAVKDYLMDIVSRYTDVEKQLAEKKITEGGDAFLNVLRRAMLQAMDMFWVEHLETMDYMRGSVNLRAYGQRDPLTEYKREGLRYFKDMEIAIEDQIVKLLPQITADQVLAQEQVTLQEARPNDMGNQNTQANLITGKQNVSNITAKQLASSPSAPKIGRNDPCPCGSGKKWKKCGELNTEEHQRLMSK